MTKNRRKRKRRKCRRIAAQLWEEVLWLAFGFGATRT